MDRLFSPWRSKYIESFHQESGGTCILCTAYQGNNDIEKLIVHRGRTSYAIMNLYPYNSGHLMIVPYRHVPDIITLSDEESSELFVLLKKMIIALRQVSKPDGFNIGSNIGRTAGAGIDSHIHFHLVPRWNGDTNFMPVLNDIKLVSEDMTETFHKLKTALQTV
jgi:ATP adenylyltransferase